MNESRSWSTLKEKRISKAKKVAALSNDVEMLNHIFAE